MVYKNHIQIDTQTKGSIKTHTHTVQAKFPDEIYGKIPKWMK